MASFCAGGVCTHERGGSGVGSQRGGSGSDYPIWSPPGRGDTWGTCGDPELDALLARSRELGQLRSQFQGPESTYIRWLIDEEIGSLTRRFAKLSGRDYTTARSQPAPVPDWMQEYITPTPMQASEYYGGRERGGLSRSRKRGEEQQANVLRPLGAQEELPPEQMGLMAGYQAWGKAGSPTSFSTQAIERMADWQRHWSYYTKQSQTLMPQQVKHAPRWRTPEQR